jgi:hypothetical protein
MSLRGPRQNDATIAQTIRLASRDVDVGPAPDSDPAAAGARCTTVSLRPENNPMLRMHMKLTEA